MPRLVLLPGAGAIEARRGSSLLALVVRAGAPLGQSCRGRGVCRACVVTVVSGAKWLGPPTDKEDAWRVEAGQRLACQARVLSADPEATIAIHSPHWGPHHWSEPNPAPDLDSE